MNTFAGIPVRIIEHQLPNRIVPNKEHRRRRGQSAAYHRRVQKKWIKRFGTHEEPVAFMFDARMFSLYPNHLQRPDTLALPRAVLLRNFAA